MLFSGFKACVWGSIKGFKDFEVWGLRFRRLSANGRRLPAPTLEPTLRETCHIRGDRLHNDKDSI